MTVTGTALAPTPSRPRSLHNLAEFDGLAVGSIDVEVSDAVLPERGDGLDLVVLEVHAERFGVLEGDFDVRGCRTPSG